MSKIRHDIYPARGRKLVWSAAVPSVNVDSPRYLPRKGTETIDNSVFGGLFGFVAIRHDIYPARGRKRIYT